MELAHQEELAAFAAEEEGVSLGEERVDEEAGGVGDISTQQRYRPTVRPPGVGVDPRPRRAVRVPTRLAAATPPPPTGAGDKRGADGSGDRPRRRVSTIRSA